ncbi:MAG: Sec-independent protein translocase protein TatB [Devosia sp.]
MFGVGWTEMLLIGVVALIVIGPKDLPVVMKQLGKAVGSIRRLGSEFQRELNKTTGLDQITDLRRSITEPLKQTAAEITREFNKVSAAGKIEPSGAVTPKIAGSESVVDEIREKTGMSPVPAGPIASPVMTGKTKSVESPAPVEAIAPAPKPARKPRAKKAAPVAVAAPVNVAAAAPVDLLGDTPAHAPAPKKPAAPRKPRAPKPKAGA